MVGLKGKLKRIRQRRRIIEQVQDWVSGTVLMSDKVLIIGPPSSGKTTVKHLLNKTPLISTLQSTSPNYISNSTSYRFKIKG